MCVRSHLVPWSACFQASEFPCTSFCRLFLVVRERLYQSELVSRIKNDRKMATTANKKDVSMQVVLNLYERRTPTSFISAKLVLTRPMAASKWKTWFAAEISNELGLAQGKQINLFLNKLTIGHVNHWKVKVLLVRFKVRHGCALILFRAYTDLCRSWSTCWSSVLSIGGQRAVMKISGTGSLWAALACVVVDPLAL